MIVAAIGFTTLAGLAPAPGPTPDIAPTDVIRTEIVLESTVRANAQRALPAYTCPSSHPYLLDLAGDPNLPRGVLVRKERDMNVFIGSALNLHDGYAAGWSADAKKAVALHFDPTFENDPRWFSVIVSCTNDANRTYTP